METPKRDLEVRLSVSSRNIETGQSTCSGGTATVVLNRSVPRTISRPMSRLAGVAECIWPAGSYRSRFTWTLTEPKSRISKQVFTESAEYRVVP